MRPARWAKKHDPCRYQPRPHPVRQVRQWPAGGVSAVAWITDETVYNILKKKKESGVTVKLIISDDDTNKNSGLDYNIFETYKMPRFGKFKYNIMHNKFCIIDLKTVLEGSYNWTKSADYHKEQFVVINSYENAEKFANRFIELRDQIIKKTYEIEF